MTLRLATRRSALALAQARIVAEALGGAELVEITTRGDRGAPGGDKSRWVAELETAVAEGRADAAVHSAKDVPGQLAEGLEIVSVPVREDARDVICGAPSPAELPAGSRVGTSSLRRRAQLRAVRDDIEVVALRGNVDTRLRRLAEGEWDAIVLAAAGLARLGRGDETGAALDPERFVPAPGQGALALEARADDARTRDALGQLNDAEAFACLSAERALCATLEASCHTPIGAHARARPQGGLELVAFAGLPDGTEWIRDRLRGDDPAELGRRVGERMRSAGAGDLLERAEALAA